MKVVIYMAMSANGFIADRNLKTPWSDEEWQEFNLFQDSCGAILVGRITYDLMVEHDELVDGANYYIASSQPNLDTESAVKYINVTSAGDLPKVDVLGVAGGTKLNTFIMSLGIVDEIILDVEPHIFTEGVPLFDSLPIDYKLVLLDTKKLNENTIQLRYKVGG